MPRGGRRSRRSVEEWRSLISSQERSGLSQIAFCRREGMALATFAKWRRRLQARERAAEFVDVTPASREGADWGVEVVLRSGVVLRLRG